MDCFIKSIGPGTDQLHGYPGHPEFELALLRLYGATGHSRFLEFARYLLSERGQKRDDLGGDSYFEWEAKERRHDLVIPRTLDSIHDLG